MTGIVFLLILFTWFFIAKKIPFLFIAGMKPGNKKTVVYLILCVLCFIAPVADEIIGGFQFRAICRQGTQLIYDADKVKGKKLLWAGGDPGTELKNTILPITAFSRALVDMSTREHLIEYTQYTVTGGWLSRFIAFNSVTRPYTFEGSCGANNKIKLLQIKLHFKTTFERE